MNNKANFLSYNKILLIGIWSIGLSLYWIILRFMISSILVRGFPRIPPEIRWFPIWPVTLRALAIGVIVGIIIGFVTLSYLQSLDPAVIKSSLPSLIFESTLFGLILSITLTLPVLFSLALDYSDALGFIQSLFDIQSWFTSILKSLFTILVSGVSGLALGVFLALQKKIAYNFPVTRSATSFSVAFFLGAVSNRLSQLIFYKLRFNYPLTGVNERYFFVNSFGSFVNGIVIAIVIIILLKSLKEGS